MRVRAAVAQWVLHAARDIPRVAIAVQPSRQWARTNEDSPVHTRLAPQVPARPPCVLVVVPALGSAPHFLSQHVCVLDCVAATARAKMPKHNNRSTIAVVAMGGAYLRGELPCRDLGASYARPNHLVVAQAHLDR